MPAALTRLSNELQSALETIRRIAVLHQVARLEVFGSGATDQLKKVSDIDLLVAFKPMSTQERGERYFGLKHSLEDTLGRSVDLIELDTVILTFWVVLKR